MKLESMCMVFAILFAGQSVSYAAANSTDLPPHPRLLLNKEGLAAFKERIERYDWCRTLWEDIKSGADKLLEEAVELPPRGGNWWHWHTCPEHSAGFRTGNKVGDWEWEHICPVDNKVFLGDPSQPETDYDGCVIMSVHDNWARTVRDLGLVYQVTGETAYAEKAREILLGYAANYKDYPLHNIRGEARVGGGRVSSQTLCESVWLIPLCQGADMVWNTLSESERTNITQNLLLPAVREVIMPHKFKVHNIQCWKNSAVGLVGFLIGDQELIDDAIHNPESGYWKQMREGNSADGMWWEGAWGYHFYTMMAVWSLTEAARNCGIDLYGPELQGMYDAPIKFATPNLRLPAFNDSGEMDLRRYADLYEVGFARYGNPAYLEVLSEYSRRNNLAMLFGPGSLDVQKEHTKLGSSNHPATGYAILTRGEGKDATWMCMKYGPHGGGHGHPDKLNFVLYSRGEPIAIDPGTIRYGSPLNAGWYRTGIAHNTLVVDEECQQPAQGKCIAFGSEQKVDYVVADAGTIYEGVRFVRTAALLDQNLLVFIDQVHADRERLLDIAYHQRGEGLFTVSDPEGNVVQAGSKWVPPEKAGYRYLRDGATRQGASAVLSTTIEDDWNVAVSLASDKPAEIITATGIWTHIDHRVPVVILRSLAKEAAVVWAVSLDGRHASIERLAVKDIEPESAVAIRVTNSDGKTWNLATNPNEQSLSISLSDGTDWRTSAVFAVR